MNWYGVFWKRVCKNDPGALETQLSVIVLVIVNGWLNKSSIRNDINAIYTYTVCSG